MLAFRILYEDGPLLAVDKPAGFHSHPPENQAIRVHPRWDGLRILQRQLNQRLFPLHRLDRATSGILLLSKEQGENHKFQKLFQNQEITKSYLCLVRGKLIGQARLDQRLKSSSGQQEALTLAEECGSFTLPLPGPESEHRTFTLVRATPVTGRYHQIRRHLAGLGFPIVGDSRHGDKKLNREFTTLTGIENLLLRCMEIRFQDPARAAATIIQAPYNRQWHRILDLAGICPLFGAKVKPLFSPESPSLF